MTPNQPGLLAENLIHFARVLRRAGLPIGPAKVIDALHAVQAVGLERRDDFSYALSAVLVNRRGTARARRGGSSSSIRRSKYSGVTPADSSIC